MKNWPHGVWAAVVLLVGFLWLRSHDAAVRAQALAEARADSLATVQQHLTTLEVQRAKEDSTARDSLARLDRASQRAAIVGLNANRRTDSLARLLAGTLTGGIRTRFDSLISAQAEVHRADSTQILSLTQALAIAQARWHAADSAAFYWKSLQAGTALQLRDAIQSSHPDLIHRVGAALPWIAGSYLLGRLTR